MDTLADFLPVLFSGLKGFFLFGFVFFVIDLILVKKPRRKILQKSMLVDTYYWFFNSMGTNRLIDVITVAVLTLVASYLNVDQHSLFMDGFGPVSKLPFWLIVAFALFIGDFTDYWTHRALHSHKNLWPIHAIHHSSTKLNWMSNVRMHPINTIIAHLSKSFVLIILGFPLAATWTYLMAVLCLSFFIHTDTKINLRALRYFIATPLFHQWHHSTENEAMDKNFAGIFPVFDLIFGTFYMPKRKIPAVYGLIRADVTESFIYQLAHPISAIMPKKNIEIDKP
jgi:sterol desaturase/sphingolipid hydroxylase (fatty acid hydroxylase superfamily)